MQFSFYDNGKLKITLKNGSSVSEVYADNTEMHFGEGKMNFEIASFIRLGKKRTEPVKYSAVYQWISDHTLKITVKWLETAHTTDITCVFGEENVTAVFSVSYRKFLLKLDDMISILNSDQCFMGEIQSKNI